jgi:hypothetical protein
VTAATSASIGVALFPGRKVENGPDPVRDVLFAALVQWISARDVRTLRRTLLEILAMLE